MPLIQIIPNGLPGEQGVRGVPGVVSSGSLLIDDLTSQITGVSDLFVLNTIPQGNYFELYWNGVGPLRQGVYNGNIKDFAVSGLSVITRKVPYLENTIIAKYLI